MLLDDTYGREALFDAAKHPLWVGRPVEVPGSRPLHFEGGADVGSRLIEWPVTHTIKCLCFFHPADDPWMKDDQLRRLAGLHHAARRLGRELLIEIIASKHGEIENDTVALVIDELYRRGIKPDWWKLEPQPSAEAWKAVGDVVTMGDPLCRGIVMLGLDAPEDELTDAFAPGGDGHRSCGASPSAARSSRRLRERGSAVRLIMPRRWTIWRAALRAWCGHGKMPRAGRTA